MKASELRIGNFVQWDDDSIVVVDELKLSRIAGKDQSGTYKGFIDSDRSAGIPITNDWLVKFGIKERIITTNRSGGEGGEDWFDVNTVLVNDDYDNPEWGYLFSMNNEGLRFVKYVHELQNLYFALTGVELIFSQVETDP